MKHQLGPTAARRLGTASLADADAIKFKGGAAKDVVLLPKLLGILPLDQAHKELACPGEWSFQRPTHADLSVGLQDARDDR